MLSEMSGQWWDTGHGAAKGTLDEAEVCVIDLKD